MAARLSFVTPGAWDLFARRSGESPSTATVLRNRASAFSKEAVPVEITADDPDGLPEDIDRAVSENARTLKFDDRSTGSRAP